MTTFSELDDGLLRVCGMFARRGEANAGFMLEDMPVSAPLTGPPGGIERFVVEGDIEGAYQHAEWDGRWVIGSPALLARAELALAVDEAFFDVPQVQSAYDELAESRPERLMYAMLLVCDTVSVAEFTRQGHRRVIAG
jgi:hypothetical protein